MYASFAQSQRPLRTDCPPRTVDNSHMKRNGPKKRSQIGKLLADLRKKAGFTSREFADELGLAHSTYASNERRAKGLCVDPDLFEKLVDVLTRRGVEEDEVWRLAGPFYRPSIPIDPRTLELALEIFEQGHPPEKRARMKQDVRAREITLIYLAVRKLEKVKPIEELKQDVNSLVTIMGSIMRAGE